MLHLDVAIYHVLVDIVIPVYVVYFSSPPSVDRPTMIPLRLMYRIINPPNVPIVDYHLHSNL